MPRHREAQVILPVAVHEHHVAHPARRLEPADEDHRHRHDGKALAHHQGDQDHIDDIGHAVEQVVNFGEQAVQLADVAPDQAENDAHDALAHSDDQGQADGHLGGVPHLAPVVLAQVVGAEPELPVGALERGGGIGDQLPEVILADGKRDKGEDRQKQEQDEEKDRSLVPQKVLDHRAPVGIVGVTDALGLFGRIIDEIKQLVVLFARKIRCFGHQRLPPFSAMVMRGSTSIIRMSPRKMPTMLSAA